MTIFYFNLFSFSRKFQSRKSHWKRARTRPIKISKRRGTLACLMGQWRSQIVGERKEKSWILKSGQNFKDFKVGKFLSPSSFHLSSLLSFQRKVEKRKGQRDDNLIFKIFFKLMCFTVHHFCDSQPRRELPFELLLFVEIFFFFYSSLFFFSWWSIFFFWSSPLFTFYDWEFPIF